MNLLGKIFTVFIALASVAVMVVSMFVYATHRNWKDDADQLAAQLSQAQAQKEQLDSSYRNLESQLTAEVERWQQQVVKLETERKLLVGQNGDLQEQVDGLVLAEREKTAAVTSTQANNESLTADVSALRTSNQENQQARDVAVATTIRATDQLHEAQGQLTALRERNAQLVQEVSTKTALLRENDVDPNTEPGAIVPSVRGVVSAMHRSAGNQLIEITVGADDGLKRGHTIEVFRGERYLGRAEIIRTEPDRAVGRVLRRFQQGQIQEGDDVATKLRVG